MRRPIVALSIALTAILAACSSSTGPGWTYAPPTEPPASQPAASGGASAAPSTAPSAEAPSGASPSAPAASDGGTGGDVVNLEAQGTNYVEKELSAPADKPWVLHFTNNDAGIPHNVVIKDASGATAWQGDTFPGVAVKDYQVTALTAGSYTFVCIVHANMTGTLKVGS